jgi:hypothetical protein
MTTTLIAKRSEHAEQTALMTWCRYNRARWPELDLLYAIPNGGHRHIAVAGKMKAEGVRRGVPDLCLPVARGLWHGLYIELKTSTGRTTPEQREWIARLQGQGYRVEVCKGWPAAAAVIEDYMGYTKPRLVK